MRPETFELQDCLLSVRAAIIADAPLTSYGETRSSRTASSASARESAGTNPVRAASGSRCAAVAARGVASGDPAVRTRGLRRPDDSGDTRPARACVRSGSVASSRPRPRRAVRCSSIREWLEAMLDAGASSAASTLAAMDANLLAVGFTEHVRVFDYAAVAPYVTLDGDVTPGKAFAEGVRCEVGGYVVCAKRLEFWEPVTAVLNAMAATQGDAFDTVMRECRRLSS